MNLNAQAATAAASNLSPIKSSSSNSNSDSGSNSDKDDGLEKDGNNKKTNTINKQRTISNFHTIRRGQTKGQELFVNKKHSSRDKEDLVRFGVAVCSRKGHLEEDLPNQDNYLFYKDQLSSIYAILDGHGPFGHIIGSVVYRFILIRFLSSMNGFLNPGFSLKMLFKSASSFVDSYFS